MVVLSEEFKVTMRAKVTSHTDIRSEFVRLVDSPLGAFVIKRSLKLEYSAGCLRST